MSWPTEKLAAFQEEPSYMELSTSSLFIYFIHLLNWLVGWLLCWLFNCPRFLFMGCRQDSDILGRLLTRVSRILYDLNSFANITLIYQLSIEEFKLRNILQTLTSHICIRTLLHIPVTKYEDSCSIFYCYKQSILIYVVKWSSCGNTAV